MPRKGPHISISPEAVVNRIFRIPPDEFSNWPQSVRNLTVELAEELFLVGCNPFIEPSMVRASVEERFKREQFALAHHYANSISEGITLFWSVHEAEVAFKASVKERLAQIFAQDLIIDNPADLIACATDATDLRLEVPLLVVEPETAEEVCALMQLANELKFAVIPVGGSSGMTGGAVPVRKRSVIIRMTRMTQIGRVDREKKSVIIQAGVITQTAVDSVNRDGYLLTIDPASRNASTIGGNVAENSGGPCAFEYGTTLDNLLSWRMVTPTGELISIERHKHPRHKILPHETATFEVRDPSGGVRSVVELQGNEIRLPGLGKDVTNKALGGLPGMQKEGVDGIILDATFIVHDKPQHSRVMILEFFGKSMHEAAVVIGEIVALRDQIRTQGDYARLSALEEFNIKYIQAIGYHRKSTNHEGLPISVIILQADGDHPHLLDRAVEDIRAIVDERETVAFMVAKDAREADSFWEDRHRLSAIAKRTSGFKLNEDVVIPMHKIPDFALFLEQINLQCAAVAYRQALQDIGRLPGLPLKLQSLNNEFHLASTLADGTESTEEILEALNQEYGNATSDDALMHHGHAYFTQLADEYPKLTEAFTEIRSTMDSKRVLVASHMHAGDGNCHVNIPVNSNDLEMLSLAEHVAHEVMQTAKDMGGAISGEHGIGITKLQFLDADKREALCTFKKRVDPRDVCNPAKLTQAALPVRPYTFSFNRLIADIKESGLPARERLINLLQTVQNCTRCGKCKQVCSMLYPERGMHYHPRNKNMVLGAVVEALTYTQFAVGKPSQAVLGELRRMVEHCTGCGKCTAVCPVKIPSADVALALRAILENEGEGGHPLKSRILSWLVRNPSARVPQMAKVAALGQRMQNQLVAFVPAPLRHKLSNPLFSEKGPIPSYTNVYDALKLNQGHLFAPLTEDGSLPEETVLYFPGCGGGLFSRMIALSTLALLLKSGVAVSIPPQHMCCGYPLLASGADREFNKNLTRNRTIITGMLEEAEKIGMTAHRIITACGSCREGLARHHLEDLPGLPDDLPEAPFIDGVQYVLPRLQADPTLWPKPIIYHAACHPAWSGLHKIKGLTDQTTALSAFTGAKIHVSHGCCGESGMGAISSPRIYNLLRERKMENLAMVLDGYPGRDPILVGCPSCKMGVTRCLIRMGQRRPVLHTTEWLARLLFSPSWGKGWVGAFCRRARVAPNDNGVRLVDMHTSV